MLLEAAKAFDGGEPVGNVEAVEALVDGKEPVENVEGPKVGDNEYNCLLIYIEFLIGRKL